MEFKNSEFEKNAAKTLQTLQELKTKLNDNFSTKGAEKLNEAIKAVDVSPISKGLETVQVQFSALQIAGKRVIENITDAAMNAVHNVTSKLTGVINQIKVGGANRAQNIENAKFMLSGLGIEWKDIVDDINYGVQDTAYGLDAAAKVASQLVASNVSLGADMQASLRGVSGVAAMTNSTYEEIGHIFTSVAGQGKLMTMQLQQFSLRGLNVAADLAKAMGTTEAAIREMVTKGQIDFMTFAKAMDELYGEHAKEANKTFTGALSNTKAALSRLGADIQSQKFESFRIILLEITTQLKEFKKAIKPAEDAIISMMDAVGKLVANFIKTIDIRGIAERISPSIKKFADYVRDFANAWLDIRDTQQKLSKIEFTNIADYYEQRAKALLDTTEEVKTSVEGLAALSDKELEKYSKNAWDIWNFGKYGNGQSRIDALGEDYEMTQAYVEKMIELGWDEAKMQEYITKEREKAAKQEARAQTVNRLKTTVSKVLTIFSNLRTVVHNVTSSIVNVLKVAFGGLNDALSGKGSGFLDALIFLTGKLADFTTKIAITKDRAEKLRPVAKAIGDVFVFIGKGVYTCIKYLIKFIEAAANNKIVKGIFEAIGNAINKIFEGLKKLYTKMKESGAWDKFVDILKTVGTWLGERIIDAINLFGDVVTTVGGGIVGVFEKIVEKVKGIGDESERGHSWLSKIGDFFKEDVLSGSWLVKLKDVLNEIFGTGKDVFQNAYTKMSDFMKGLVAGLNSIGVTDLSSAISVIGQIALIFTTAKWLWSMSTLNKRISDGFKNLDKLFGALKTTVKQFGRKADAEAFVAFAEAVAIIVGSFLAILFSFAYLKSKGVDYVPIAKEAGRMVLVYTIIIGAIVILKTLAMKAAYVTGSTVSAFGKIKIPAFAATMAAIAYLLKVLIDSFVTMYDIVNSPGYNSTNTFAVTLNIGLLLIALMAFAAALSKVDKTLVGLSGAAFMIISLAVLFKTVISAFKKVLKLVKDAKSEDIKQATSTINWLMIPILAFGTAIVFLTRKFKTDSTTQSNPFKGVIGLFVGLAAMLRLGFVPLLKAITEIRKEGDVGVSAIHDFKTIINTLYIFIGLITLAVTVLGNFKYNGRNIGSAALGQNRMSGAFSIGGSNGAFYGVSAIILSIAAVIYTMSLAIKSMKGVDISALNQFKQTLLLITGIIALMSIALAAIGTIDMSKGATGVLLGVTGIILGIAAVIAASAWAFKTFNESLQGVIDYLPVGLQKIRDFFAVISDEEVRAELVDGVYNTASILRAAFVSAIVGWSYGIVEAAPVIVQNLFAGLIVALNSLADEFYNDGPELVNAADRCALGLLYFATIVLQKFKERSGEILKNVATNTIGKGLVNLVEGLIPGLDLDWDESIPEYTGPDPEELKAQLKKEAEDKAATTSEYFYKNYYAALAEENRKNSESTALPVSFKEDSDAIDKIINDVTKKFDFTGMKRKLLSGISSGDIGLGDLKNVFSTGDYTKLSDMLGVNLSMDEFTEAFNNFDFTTQEGLNDAMDYFSTFQNDSGEGWADWADMLGDAGTEGMENLEDGIAERMTFVTQITNEAMTASVTEATKFESDFYTVGENCAKGYAEGLTNMASVVRVMQASKDLANVSKNAITAKDALDERSPSHVFEKIGIFTVLGFANGIKNSVRYATEATTSAAEATILSMRETIRNASLEAVNGIDNPRITPVLDLSNITNGIETMNGLFDTTPAYELAMATSGEARAATATRNTAIYQNGSPYDDTNAIGAINALNAEVSTLKDSIEGMQVVLDGRALVGQIATPIDKALGRKTIAGRRKV